jgi:isopentenyl-diphosphate delta-isomerase
MIAMVDLVLPAFRYRATAADGTVENELCPVYRVVTDDNTFSLDATEVDDVWWVTWAAICATTPDSTTPDADDPSGGSDPLSPWATKQVRQLAALGPDPLRWPQGEPKLLPPAALP